MKKLFTVFSLILISGCTNLEISRTIVEQKYNVRKIAGIGDSVYSSSTRKGLPNVIRRAGLYGRTTITGKTNVIFVGIKNNKAVFQKKTVDVSKGQIATHEEALLFLNTIDSLYCHHDETIVMRQNPILYDRSTRFIAVDIYKLPQTFNVEGNTITVYETDALKTEVSLSK